MKTDEQTGVTALETAWIESGSAKAYLAPSRGGILTRFTVGDRDVLYLDDATLLDPTKNVRGGNPVLFPSPGPLAGDRFEWRGKKGAMKQHGVARNMAWRAEVTSEGSVLLRTASDDTTLAQFPFRFALAYRYTLAGPRLRIDQRIENTGDEPMPFAAGFHPYFAVRDEDKTKTRVPTNAKRAWDNVAKREIALARPIELAAPEVDLHLVDHGSSEASLELADGARVVVRGSAEYGRWVIWTLAGKDYVCLEPWTAAANAINTGESLLVVAPREAKELFVEFELVV